MEVLREFRVMLHGVKLNMFADRQNLTFNTSNSRVRRWILLMEEHDCHLKYIKIKGNMIADSMSRMRTSHNEDSLFSDDMFYIEALSNNNVQLNESHLEFF